MRKDPAMVKSKIRILGEPKPPQTGQFSSKVAKKSGAEPNVKPAKKASPRVPVRAE
jgi:hypothetical protein